LGRGEIDIEASKGTPKAESLVAGEAEVGQSEQRTALQDSAHRAPGLQGWGGLDPGRPISQIIFYRFWYWMLLSFLTAFYRARFFNTLNVPDAGGLLVISNHQSLLDPPLVGVALRRRNMAAIAKAPLFNIPILGWWLRNVGCISVKEDAGDAGAMRAGIEQLKRGRLIVIFPEGSRTPDGTIKPFKRGVWLLMMRSGVPVLPAAVEGCYEAWPRQKKFPNLFGHRVGVNFGTPIPFQELKALGSDAGLARLQSEVESLRAELAQRLGKNEPRTK
jgi:1-acyl-sn-glycerol-3-phosphate acyltransferase